MSWRDVDMRWWADSTVGLGLSSSCTVSLVVSHRLALTFSLCVQHGVVSSSCAAYSAMLHLAPTLAQPHTVPASTALDSALQNLWVSAVLTPPELPDAISSAVTELRAERHKRRLDPVSAFRIEDSSDDEDVYDVVNRKRIRTLAVGSGAVQGGRRDLRNKTKKESLKPMAAPLLASHPITEVSGPCTDATAVSDHLALFPPQLKLALVKYARASFLCGCVVPLWVCRSSVVSLVRTLRAGIALRRCA